MLDGCHQEEPKHIQQYPVSELPSSLRKDLDNISSNHKDNQYSDAHQDRLADCRTIS
jgi:hypothetical protein